MMDETAHISPYHGPPVKILQSINHIPGQFKVDAHCSHQQLHIGTQNRRHYNYCMVPYPIRPQCARNEMLGAIFIGEVSNSIYLACRRNDHFFRHQDNAAHVHRPIESYQ